MTVAYRSLDVTFSGWSSCLFVGTSKADGNAVAEQGGSLSVAIICRDLGLLFVMVPGTGCSVVGNELTARCGGEFIPMHDMVQGGKIIHDRKHNTVSQLLQDSCLTEEELGKLLVVATVRNPLDSFVTYYQRAVGDWTDYSQGVQVRQVQRDLAKGVIAEDEAESWVQAIEVRHQKRSKRKRLLKLVGFSAWVMAQALRYRFLSGYRLFQMLDDVDVAICYEHLEDGVNQVLKAVGYDGARVCLPRKNVTPGKRPFLEYYGALSKRFVCSVLHSELSRFGYPDGLDASVTVLAKEKLNSLQLAGLNEPMSAFKGV